MAPVQLSPIRINTLIRAAITDEKDLLAAAPQSVACICAVLSYSNGICRVSVVTSLSDSLHVAAPARETLS